MEKSYTGRYPELKDKQSDFLGTVVSMLNCRRYLENQGFDEKITGIITNTGYNIVLEDSSRISSREYLTSHDRDSLLEQIILKGGILEIIDRFVYCHMRGGFYEILLNKFVTDNISVNLQIEDTGFWRKAKKFAVSYTLKLDKDIINDRDLKTLSEYSEELPKAAKSEIIVNSGGSARNTSVAEQLKPEQKPLEVFDPWKIEIDELENIAYGERK